MQLNEAIYILTTVTVLIGAAAAIIRERRKPQLDAAQAENALVNSESVKATIKQMTDKANAMRDQANAMRDLHMLALEDWAFEEVRPWGREVVVKYDKQNDLLRELGKRVDVDVPEDHLPPFPEMPARLFPLTDQ